MSVKIHNCSNNNTIYNTKSWVEYNEKVAEALEKQTPKKPQEVDADFNTFDCPSCLSTIKYTDEKETHNYCLNCGQKLDWRMENVLSDMARNGIYVAEGFRQGLKPQHDSIMSTAEDEGEGGKK